MVNHTEYTYAENLDLITDWSFSLMLLPRGRIVPHKHRKVPNLKIQSMVSPACLSVFFLWCHKLSKTSCTCQVRTPPSYILSPFLYFFPCILQDRASLCSCGYSGTQFVDKDDLKITLRFKKKKRLIYQHVCLLACVCVHSALGGQKRVLGPFKLDADGC